MPRKWFVLVGISVSVTLFFLSALTGSAAPAATITVNTVKDLIATDAKCSLREAIQAANTNAAVNECPAGTTGPDTIVFNVGSGTPTIQVKGSALPSITSIVSINGNSGGATRIELDGSGAGANAQGLTLATNKTTVRALVINRFSGNGIEISGGASNIVVGSLIGTNAAGTAALGNSGVGIHLGSTSKATIGGATVADRNIISGNASHGIEMDNELDINVQSTGNTIRGNFIGTDMTGTLGLGNGGRGVFLFQSSSNTIGGTAGVSPGGSCTGACNLISGNGTVGITVGRLSTNNKVLGNFVGTDVTGTADLGNTEEGVFLTESSSNFVGGTTAGSGNLISGNDDDGILLVFSTGNTIQGNLVGTNTTGNAALANSGRGVLLDRTFGNTVGGTTLSARNVISGNTDDGIFVGASTNQAASHDNIIQGNYIGIRSDGIGALANGGDGIDVSRGEGNIIGGTTGTTPGGACTGACNVISGNIQYGIRIRDGASNTTVQGNIIGPNAPGDTTPGGNGEGGIGILDTSNHNQVGGTNANARNVISANQGYGIEIHGAGAADNIVQGNFIGTPTGGLGSMFNTGSGILVRGPHNTIGGTEAGAGNVVSGNFENGISIQGEDTTGNRVQGNFIGTDVTGTADLGNGEDGIEFVDDQPSGNQIGGKVSDTTPVGGNVIAFNNKSGVRINGGDQNAVRFNSIFSNVAPEIDLSFGNNDQPAPVLTAATLGSTNIQGTLTAAPSTAFVLDFYQSPNCPHAQGKIYLGSENVTTNSGGSVNFISHQTTGAPLGSFITATATDPNNNTSEFSNCVQVVQGPTFTPTHTATRTPTPTATPTTGCTAKPEKPVLKAPADDAVLSTVRPRLKWNALPCTDTFTLIVKNAATGQKIEKVVGLTRLKYKVQPLATGITYKWFVKGCNTFGCRKSVPREFTIP